MEQRDILYKYCTATKSKHSLKVCSLEFTNRYQDYSNEENVYFYPVLSIWGARIWVGDYKMDEQCFVCFSVLSLHWLMLMLSSVTFNATETTCHHSNLCQHQWGALWILTCKTGTAPVQIWDTITSTNIKSQQNITQTFLLTSYNVVHRQQVCSYIIMLQIFEITTVIKRMCRSLKSLRIKAIVCPIVHWDLFWFWPSIAQNSAQSRWEGMRELVCSRCCMWPESAMKTNTSKHKPPLSGGNEAAIHAETYTDAYDRQRHCVQRDVKGIV